MGGGLALAGSTNATILNSAFDENRASSTGGGVALLGQTYGTLSGANFTSNYAVTGGAGVYVLRSNSYGSNITANPFLAR